VSVRITAVGLVSPHGVDVEPDGPAVFETDFDAESYTDPRTLRKVSELTRMVTVAVARCLEQARFPDDPALRDATSVLLGNCFGSSRYHLEYHEALRRRGPGAASALLFAESVFNAASSHVAKVHRLRGANLTLVGGETVGLQAIALAADRIRLGSAPAVLAGGAEQNAELTLASLRAQGLLETGFAEGAAILLLEDDRREIPALARLLGSGSSRRGAEAAARKAQAEAGLTAEVCQPEFADGFAFSAAARVAIAAGRIARGECESVLVQAQTRDGNATAVVLGRA